MNRSFSETDGTELSRLRGRVEHLLARNTELLEVARRWEAEANQEHCDAILWRNEVKRLRDVNQVLASDIEESYGNGGEPPSEEVAAALNAVFPPLCPLAFRPLEDQVADWVCTRIGPNHLQSKERAMRLLEEALELAQAEGIERVEAYRQMGHVYDRPAGEPAQEAAGVAVTLLGWCASNGLRLMELAKTELRRIEAKPLEEIRGSLARKADADLVTCVDAPGVEA